MSNIYIWGTGKLSDAFFTLFCENINVCGYIETIPTRAEYNGLKVFSIDEIKSLEFDYIIVANTHYKEIISKCENLGINVDKILNIYDKKIGITDSELGLYTFDDACNEKWFVWNEMLLCTNDIVYYRNKTQKNDFSNWWYNCDSNVLLRISNRLFDNIIRVINTDIIPCMNKETTVLDIGCSNGVVDEYISEYCKEIDACDYSPKSIEDAKTRAHNNNIGNIYYYVCDAKEIDIEKKYDIVFVLGLTIYFDNDEDVINIIKIISSCLKNNGKVLVKDSLNTCSRDNIYHCNFNNGYQSCYRNMDVYEQMWKNNGFKIVKKEILADDINIGIIEKMSIAYIFEKIN